MYLTLKLFVIKNIVKWFVSFDRFIYLILKAKNTKYFNLYGAGYLGVEVFLYLQSRGLKIHNWYDIKANEENYSVLGQKIKPTHAMKNQDKDFFVIICSREFEKVMNIECIFQSLDEVQIISWST